MGGEGLLAAGVRDGDAQKGVRGGRPHAEAVRMEDLDAVCAQRALDLLSASRRAGQGQRAEEAHVVRRRRTAEDGIEHRVRAAGRHPLAFQQGLRRAIQDEFAEDFVFRSRTWEKLERIWDTEEQRSHRARSLQVAFLLSETALHQ